jgi:glycosyltransferase involved in cell wall biosynthesis
VSKVSVIIPAYNVAATVAAAIESVLAQTVRAVETIVVNDGSTDETASVLGRYAGHIVVVTQENRGLAAARNAGARAATGEWLAFLDADDTWTADKLEKTVAAVSGDSETVLVFSDATCIDESGTVLPRPFMEADRARAPSMDDMLAGRFQIRPSSVSVRRDAFERAGGFSEEFRVPSFEDAFCWVVMREQGPFVFIADAPGELPHDFSGEPPRTVSS